VAEGWRLLRDGPESAAWNMAVDEALLLGGAGPALRLYTWRDPAISLGYRQAPPAWIERARAAGLERVRRATGGGAVLHGGDLTYSVVAPRGTRGLPDDLLGSCAWIRSVLREALSSLGLAARPAGSRKGADRLALCFAGATGLEIELAGSKLVGSAQRRTSWGLLQHGSIRLRDDSPLYARLLAQDGPEGGVSVPPAPPVELLESLAPERVMDAIECSFADRLDAPLVPAPLSAAERHLAQTRASLRLDDDLARLPLASSEPPLRADSSF
jgi:lipoate-protein ligase A